MDPARRPPSPRTHKGPECCFVSGTCHRRSHTGQLCSPSHCSLPPWHWFIYLLMWHPKGKPHPSCWGHSPPRPPGRCRPAARFARNRPQRNALDSPSSARHRVTPEFTHGERPPGAGHRLGLWGQSGQLRPMLAHGQGEARQHVPALLP